MVQKIYDFFENRVAKLLKNPWFLAWLVLPFIKPATEFTGKFDAVFDLLKLLHCGFILLSYRFIQKKPSKMIVLIGCFQATLFASTVLNHGEIKWSAVQLLSILSLCALLELSLNLDRKAAIRGFSLSLGLMAGATVITMFACYPNGLYTVVTDHNIRGLWHIPETNNYLWGFDNSSAFRFIPAMIFFILATDPKSKKSKSITFAVLFIISLAFIYIRSIMALLGCLLLLVFYTFIYLENRPLRWLNLKHCVIFVCIIAVVLIGLNSSIAPLQKIAEKTDKVTSLNYRFTLWKNTTDQITQSPLLGYGVEDRMVTAQKIGIDHPHNIFLDILYRGGLIGGAFFAWMLICACKRSFKGRKTLFGNTLTFGFLAFLLMSQMDYYNEQYLPFLLFILADHTDLFIFSRKKAEPTAELTE